MPPLPPSSASQRLLSPQVSKKQVIQHFHSYVVPTLSIGVEPHVIDELRTQLRLSSFAGSCPPSSVEGEAVGLCLHAYDKESNAR